MKYQALAISEVRAASPFFLLCLHNRLLLFLTTLFGSI